MNVKLQLLASVRLIAFDFDGVFTDNHVYINQDGIESVRCWRGDGLGISSIRSIGLKTAIISTEVNPVVSARASKLGVPCHQAVRHKDKAITEICAELNIPLQDTMFVGNDINDIPAFQSVGFPVAVADAHPDVKPYVIYQTELPGGKGAVREICDLVIKCKRKLNL